MPYTTGTMWVKLKRQTGFTVIELIVVIAVIGILAAITIVAYNGIQAEARDTQRKSDIITITKGLELYYAENRAYPTSGGSTAINSGWSTTADASWAGLAALLKPHIGAMPVDPVSTPSKNVTGATTGIYNYAYYVNKGNWCGAAPYQMYILVYRLDSEKQDTFEGDCPTNPLSYASPSNYRVVRQL